MAGWLRAARSVVVLTGAGISTDSGIPDFRGPNGIWTNNPGAVRYSTIEAYVSDPEVRRRAWQLRLEHPAWTARPNDGHRALTALAGKVPLDLLITQNIDGLHQSAGSSPDSIVELHGTIHDFVCLKCGDRGPMQDALARVRAGDDDPRCLRCGGLLKSATVSFGQQLEPASLAKALSASERCEVFLAVGTSLAVYPAAMLPEVAVSAGARLVIFNAEPTPQDGIAAAVVREPVGVSLPSLLALL